METATQSTRVCQWCTNPIAPDAAVCQTCGAATPNPELTVPGMDPVAATPAARPADDVAAPVDEMAEARAIVERLNRIDTAPAAPRSQRDAADDLPMIVGVLVGAAVIGGLVGWLLLPPILADLFEAQLGIEADGPGDFRRMGAFIGALGSLLFGALLGVVLRR